MDTEKDIKARTAVKRFFIFHFSFFICYFPRIENPRLWQLPARWVGRVGASLIGVILVLALVTMPATSLAQGKKRTPAKSEKKTQAKSEPTLADRVASA